MQSVEIITNSSQETKKAGFALAFALEKEPLNQGPALVIAFEGDLGAGKTTFIQGFAQGLGIKENVLSPTFVIQKDFSLAIKNYKNFYHIDAYRLKNPGELLELGFKDLIQNTGNIIEVECADKIKKILPKNILKIELKNLGENKRKITVIDH